MALHCPATLLVAPTPPREGGLHPLVEEVGRELIMAVVTGPDDARGAELAGLLDVPHEIDLAIAQGPSRAVLTGVADLHRGETVVVLTGPPQSGESRLVRMELGDG